MNRCPVFGCQAEREKPWHLVCVAHWQALPLELQAELYALFKRERGGKAHMAAIKRALKLLSALPEWVR